MDTNDDAGPTISEHPRAPRNPERPRSTPPVAGPDAGVEASSAPTAGRTGVVRSGLTTTTGMTARGALEASGAGHMRAMAISMLALIQLGFLASWLFEASLTIKLTAWLSLSTLLGLFAIMWLQLRRHNELASHLQRKLTVPLCLAVVCANYAFGLTSGFAAAVAIGLGTFAASTRGPAAKLAYGAIAVGYGLATLLQALGILADAPLFPTQLETPWQHAAAAGAIELIYFAAYATGRMTRREHKHVVEQFEQAVREASMRDALLREAQEAFRHAAGIGGPGRFTDQVLDRFRLGSVIGRGGMGEVYEAECLDSGDQAAVKLLRLDALGERSALSRFEREARIAASIRSPHVVRVLAVSGADSVFPYIAMERLHGTDLASHLRDRGQLPLDEVIGLVSQLARGLAAAHELKIVHRDLKPNNVFRSTDGVEVTWRILDFGVSKLLESADATLTVAELIGTPQYMAPEQARGERQIDQRVDLYALAAIAYRALCGEPPFTGQLPAILTRIAENMPAAPSSRASVPADVDLALALGLAKDPQTRLSDVRDFADAFATAAVGHLSPALRRKARALLRELPYAA